MKFSGCDSQSGVPPRSVIFLSNTFFPFVAYCASDCRCVCAKALDTPYTLRTSWQLVATMAQK